MKSHSSFFYKALICYSSKLLESIKTILHITVIQALRNKSSFYTFFLINIVLSVASYVAVTSRKAALDQYAYMRVNQQFEP